MTQRDSYSVYVPTSNWCNSPIHFPPQSSKDAAWKTDMMPVVLLIGLNSIRSCKNVYNNSILVKAPYAIGENTSFSTKFAKKRKEEKTIQIDK